MIAEHTFVTTLPEPEAFAEAHAVLQSLGFTAAQGNSSGASSASCREWVRGIPGRRSGSRSRRGTLVRMDFDRGRVTLAVYIAAEGRAAGSFTRVALSIANALDRKLALRQPLDDARAEAAAIDLELMRGDRRRTIAGMSIIAILILGIVVMIWAGAAHAHT